jgi:hypothetical protein
VVDEVVNSGMSLLFMAFMLHAGILKNIIQTTEECLDTDPHCCIGAIFSLKEILQKEQIYPTHVVFIDYSNASDDVDRDSFLNVFESHCINGNLINALKRI